MIKKIALGLLAILVMIQFIRPEKNVSDDRTYDISTAYAIPDDVANTLEVACNDCHSNKTRYPWYAEIQPVAWFLDDHVQDGKRHLNFSTFTKLPIAVQNHKLEETLEMVEAGEMPLKSYTNFGLHPEAKITYEQRQAIIQWARAQMDTLKANYPADSLKMKPRKPTS
ncbi:heme-binding domain-containing protein [Arundinibacter roseus]|uniref:Cytochrome C n=1 Tax=Arundinibacter roseus TaxID=2070510 RepID=A0A4R4K8R8_9BACT|nr:heme-binding domain-containing protein [Arundinibacter roseus]TDB64127.1 cytochrome C [Arundinibacter roseus]